MKEGDRYVVYSENTLYRLSHSSCSEGDSVNLNNTSVQTYRLINGRYLASQNTTLSSYQNSSYVCHIYHPSTDTYDINFLLLPAVAFCLCFFFMIYKWFIRLRG